MISNIGIFRSRNNAGTNRPDIRHLAIFVSNLWQIHIFGEGNIRTTAVFLRNLLLNEENELHNQNLHTSGLLKIEKVDIGERVRQLMLKLKK